MPEPKIFFTADTHFFHRGIIEHAERNFRDVDEMNWTMAAAINRVVGENDILYHVGDFAWNRGDFLGALEMLNVKQVHLMKGNHDEKGAVRRALESGRLKSAQDLLYLRARGHKFLLSHYAFQTWRRGWFQLHGHSHGGLAGKPMRLDVGVDTKSRNGFSLTPLPVRPFGQPWQLEEIVALLSPELPAERTVLDGESSDD